MSIRSSSLPVLQFCGLSARLSAAHGAGRAAALSKAFHARCAGDETEMHRLTSAERAEVDSWQAPEIVVVTDEDGESVSLVYDAAEKELEVCLNSWGAYWPDAASALVVGHLDFAWAYGESAYVADIKKSRWATRSGPESLQLHSYGMAYAKMRGCSRYLTGIWLPVDGEWQWAHEWVVLGSERHQRIWADILVATGNEGGEANVGSHCNDCYQRLHCPEWTLPAALSQSELAAVAAGQIPDDESARRALRYIQALDGDAGILARAKDQLKQWVKRGEVFIEDGDKEWAPKMVQGRESLDMAKLKHELGDLARFKKKGADFEQWQWRKKRLGAGETAREKSAALPNVSSPKTSE